MLMLVMMLVLMLVLMLVRKPGRKPVRKRMWKKMQKHRVTLTQERMLVRKRVRCGSRPSGGR